MLQRIHIVLVFVCLPALPLAAQQSIASPDAATPSALTIRMDTRIVNLPLVVRDKRGALVKSLSKDELTLTEDGKPQTIRYFDHDANLPLALGLLVDVSYSQRDALDEERTASQSFLDEMLGASDKAFVIEFAREVDLLADTTGSHAALQASLAQLTINPPSTDSTQGDSQGRTRGGGGTQLYDAIFLASDEVIKKQPNRKALIVLTDGVDHGSKESLAQAIEAAQRADTLVYAIYFAGTEQHSPGFGNHGGNQGGGRSGGGWPGGGGGWPGGGGRNGGGGQGGGNRPHTQEEHVDGRKILERITFETGGDFFEVTKKQTVASIYQQIADELRNQYRLEYTPPEHDGPGFHEVVVLPKDTKLTVQTRTGYYSDK